MAPLLYKVIKNDKQYYAYNRMLYDLVFKKKKHSKDDRDVIELLQVLIEHYDKEHNSFEDADPVEMLQFQMDQHNIKATDLAKAIGISKNLLSDILNYRRSISKSVVRKFSEHFKTSQEMFNRPYHLRPARKKLRKKTSSKKSQLVH